jgi:Carboxypeptidase regulatory-like domain
MRRLQVGLGALLLLVLVPAMAFAQATITGVVKDASGAILPGVTVEASSPVLIEKTRAAVTDSTGTYRIVDLRPGTYSVSFALTGFSTVKRDGVELAGSFTATINADMKVGALEETITVTGETPIVDTQSVRRQVVISDEVIKSMPAARAYAGMMMLIPATITQAGANLDVQITPGMLVFGGAGGRNNEARLQVDGLNTGAAFNGGGVSSYVPDIGNAQEIATTTSGGLGEAEVGGPSFSIVPKTGGNSIKGALYASGVTSGMVGSNYTDTLKTAGLTSPQQLEKVWDYNVGVGGPIKKDKVWFFLQFRDEGSHRTVPGMFANANLGDPTKFLYFADLSRPAKQAGSWRNGAARVTFQPTTRNKFNIFWDEQHPCQGAAFPGTNEGCRQSGPNEIICGAPSSSNASCSATSAPETGTYLNPYGQRVQQATWTSPVTNKLLLEAGVGTYLSRWGGSEMPGNPTRNIVRITEACPATTGCANNGNIAGLVYGSENWAADWQGTHSWRASASYVTGTNSMKFGYQGGFLKANFMNGTNNQQLSYTLNNGVPTQFTEQAGFFQPQMDRGRYDAFYAQDQWTRSRLTLQAAIRYDHAWSWFPAVDIGGVRFLPQTISFQDTSSLPLGQGGVDSYKDLTPRVGVAYDVFGNGKTALKINAGRYLEAAQLSNSYVGNRPSTRLSLTAARNWTDNNKNYLIDCNLSNNAAQSPTTTGSIDTCAAAPSTFGTSSQVTQYDTGLLNGWGVRPGDWGFGVSVQQQVMPRVSVEVGYNRRWLDNFTTVDNRDQQATDYTAFSVVAPSDSRLPGGGGQTITGLYNVNPNVVNRNGALVANTSANDAYNTLSANYGSQYQRYNGILLNVSARVRNGLTFQGGMNTGKTVSDYCDVRSQIPEWTVLGAQGPSNPYCHADTGFVTRYTGLGSYIIPKIDVQLSGTFRSDQGAPLAANFAYAGTAGSAVAASLGRPLSNAAPNVTVNLIAPGVLYGDRVNEVDVRFAKILKFGRTRTNVGIDLYNIINSAAVLSYNQNFNTTVLSGPGSWLQPTSVLQPRFVKISATIDF